MKIPCRDAVAGFGGIFPRFWQQTCCQRPAGLRNRRRSSWSAGSPESIKENLASSVWKGHISFGLVTIPVRLLRAARSERVPLRELYRVPETGAQRIN